jgi:hypothetical protein
MKKIKLSETKGMTKIIATKELQLNGEYFCLINGEKTEVIK